MIELILLERVNKLGNLGDIVKAKPGYARNFLIPKGKARRATSENKKYFEERRAELELAQADRISKAEGLRARMDGMTLHITRKAGMDGRLFGSVSQTDVVASLKAQGFDDSIHKSMVLMPDGHIKTLGDFKVRIHIQADVEAVLNVSVLAEPL